MYDNAAKQPNYGTMGTQAYAGNLASPPEPPLLEYATQEIQRLSADLAAQVREVNGFVDGVRGPIPTLLGSVTDTASTPLPPPNRGEALREAIRTLQAVRNAGDEAVKRLGGI
jgi:hypothetical protein